MRKRKIEIPDRQSDGKQVHPIVLKRILAPTDLTPDGKKAVEYAVALAEHFNSQVTLLHVYDVLGDYDYARTPNDYGIADPSRRTLRMLWIRSGRRSGKNIRKQIGNFVVACRR